MKRKKASALASLSMILLAFLALVLPVSSPGPETHRYWIMSIERINPGNVVIIDSLNEAPIEEGRWNFTTLPLFSSQNITFSEPWLYSGVGWIVNLTVPAASYVGLSYMFWSTLPPLWFRFSTSMSEDGHGWIFLNATGDVDCHTFSNNTAAYWRSPSPRAGEKAADHGALPSPGPDGVAGTADDGFGDGTNDTRGSSILILPTILTAEYHDGDSWVTLFAMSWPQILTTGNASTIVIEPDGGPGSELYSQIDGANQTVVGQPWEFLAGLDHPEYDPIPYDHPGWNAYVTYVCAWSLLDIWTTMGDYDICFTIIERKFREDCVIPDIKGEDEEVKIFDIRRAAKAYDTYDNGFGEDGIPYTGDDIRERDPLYMGAADVKDCVHVIPAGRGHVDIFDIRRIAKDYGKKLTPDGVIRP